MAPVPPTPVPLMVTEVGKVIGLAAVMEVRASVPPVPRGPPLTVKDPRPRASLDPKDRTPLLTVVAPGKALVTVALLPESNRSPGVGKLLLMSTFSASLVGLPLVSTMLSLMATTPPPVTFSVLP